MEENVVLCGSSAYEKKYYLNPDFESLPDSIKISLPATVNDVLINSI